jgi:hypothetical protein
MANTIQFVGYSKGTGRNSFMRIFLVAFSGSYVQSNAEVINFSTALNLSGIEDMQVPISASPSIPPLVLGSTLNGYQPEIQIGGTGTAGQYGITFWISGGGGQAAAGVYSGLFPTGAIVNTVQQYGQVLIGIMDSLG